MFYRLKQTSPLCVSALPASANICLPTSSPLCVFPSTCLCSFVYLWNSPAFAQPPLTGLVQVLFIVLMALCLQLTLFYRRAVCQLQRRLQAPLWMEATSRWPSSSSSSCCLCCSEGLTSTSHGEIFDRSAAHERLDHRPDLENHSLESRPSRHYS